MALLIGISAGLILFALICLGGCVRSLRRRRMVRAGGAGLSFVFSGTLAAIGIMLALSYLSYQRLTDEQLVSRIEFRELSPQAFEARVMRPGQLDQLFVLLGDEWQLDARIVTWKPPLTVLGLDPIFRLDRLSGRYADLDRERTAERSVHALAESETADIWEISREFPVLLPGIDAHYGTATYVPMADGARFEVTLSRDALIARPANENARNAVGEWSAQ